MLTIRISLLPLVSIFALVFLAACQSTPTTPLELHYRPPGQLNPDRPNGNIHLRLQYISPKTRLRLRVRNHHRSDRKRHRRLRNHQRPFHHNHRNRRAQAADHRAHLRHQPRRGKAVPIPQTRLTRRIDVSSAERAEHREIYSRTPRRATQIAAICREYIL